MIFRGDELILRPEIFSCMRFSKFIRQWALIWAIIIGIGSYFLADALVTDPTARGTMLSAVEIVQPLMIFAMLFITFCNVNPRRMALRPWHWWLIAVQAGVYLLLTGVAMLLGDSYAKIVVEGAMICFICPVATAAAVVTRRLGGSATQIVTYTILINLVASILIPATVPLVMPEHHGDLWGSMLTILGKVLPLLLLPLMLAWIVRSVSLRVHYYISSHRDLAFRLWVVSLALAMAVTTRMFVKSSVPLWVDGWLVAVTAVCCLGQFAIGRLIGSRYRSRTTAGQALGQKNTVLAIWLGYTFYNPVTALVGGFYSIFHNVINSYQLYKRPKR